MYFYDNGIKISESDLKEALAYSDPYTFLGREIFKCIQDVMKKKYHSLLEYANRHGHDIGAKLIDVTIING